MASPNLERLAREGELQHVILAPPDIRRLMDRAAGLLLDSKRESLATESRVSLVCEAAFAVASAALARRGYRTISRDLAFQCLEHTAGSPPAEVAVMAMLLQRYRRAERDGSAEAEDLALVEDAGRIVTLLIERVSR